ncbi:hypothetical protein REPUB_Repub09cG0176600 [Reevesia pubescens]
MKLMAVFSIFVNNIPAKVHWRWLQNIFDFHGKVVDVFILKKRSNRGQKFGFVRFASLSEAKTTARSLNGVWLLDHRIKVNFSRFNARSSYWRKVSSSNLVE